MNMLTIGQMAEMNGVSRQTLRLYDEIGLLKPSAVGKNAYRYYDLSQCARLDMIQYMKSLGMELRVIKEQLDKNDINFLRSILQQKKEDIDRQVQTLGYQKRAIELAISAYELYEHAPPEGAIVLQYIEKRFMYIHDSGVNFYEYSLEMYERILRKLKMDLRSKQLPQIYFHNVGTILSREQFLSGEFYATEFFVFVDQEYVPEEVVTTLESGMFLCIYCNRFEKERDYTKMLMEEVHRKGYQVTGDCICEVILDAPMLDDDSRRGMFF